VTGTEREGGRDRDRQGGRGRTVSPRVKSPELGGKRPASIFTNVDLPTPAQHFIFSQYGSGLNSGSTPGPSNLNQKSKFEDFDNF